MLVPELTINSANTSTVVEKLETSSDSGAYGRVQPLGRGRLAFPDSAQPATGQIIDLGVLNRVEHITAELDALKNLREGWDTYGAPPINHEVIDYALRVYAHAAIQTSRVPSVVPTVAGGVQFEWHSSRADVEIEIVSAGEIDVFARARNGERRVEAEGVDAHDPSIAEAIRLLA